MKKRILAVLLIALFGAGVAAGAAEPTATPNLRDKVRSAEPTGTPSLGVVTAIDTRTGLVTAKVKARGKTFQFKADAAALRSLKVGRAVFADFETNRVSLDGKKACCQIVAARGVRSAEPAGARTMEGLTQQAVSLPIPLAKHEKGQEMMRQAMANLSPDINFRFIDKTYDNDQYQNTPFGKVRTACVRFRTSSGFQFHSNPSTFQLTDKGLRVEKNISRINANGLTFKFQLGPLRRDRRRVRHPALRRQSHLPGTSADQHRHAGFLQGELE